MRIKIVDLIDRVLMNHDNDSILNEVKKEVNRWMHDFPLYEGKMAWEKLVDFIAVKPQEVVERKAHRYL